MISGWKIVKNINPQCKSKVQTNDHEDLQFVWVSSNYALVMLEPLFMKKGKNKYTFTLNMINKIEDSMS